MNLMSERQKMILRALNNTDYLMSPISHDDLIRLCKELGEEVFARDLKYLEQIGLVQQGAVTFGANGHVVFNSSKIALTAKGVDYVNIDTIGSELDAVTIKIDKHTLEQIESIINAANLPETEKITLLKMVKEKGAEKVVSKCIDVLFSNAGSAAMVLSELAKRVL